MRFKGIISAFITVGLVFGNSISVAAADNSFLKIEQKLSILNAEHENLSVSKKSIFAYEKTLHKNPSFEEIEKIIEDVAVKKGIPPTILKSVAYVESHFRQFKENGQPYIYNGISYGVMQVTPLNHYDFDVERLKYDIEYNIECGAEIILNKWKSSFNEGWSIPEIGDMDPRVLENWYFTLWAYNSWNGRNNPNNGGNKQYQLRIIDCAQKIFGQDISPIDEKLLPQSGTPDSNLVFETPEIKHIEDFVGIKKSDLILDGSMEITGTKTRLKDKSEAGSDLGVIEPTSVIEILGEPVSVQGKLMYNVRIFKDEEMKDSVEGWAELKNKKDMRNCDFDKSGDIDVIDILDILSYIHNNKSTTKNKEDITVQAVNDEQIKKYDINYDDKIDMMDVYLVDSKCKNKMIDYEKYEQSNLNIIIESKEIEAYKQIKIKFDDIINEDMLDKSLITVMNENGDMIEAQMDISKINNLLLVNLPEICKKEQRYYVVINEENNSKDFTIMKYIVK